MRWIKKVVIPKYEFWSRWYAWYPVDCELNNGTNAVVWLETVERRGTFGYGGISWRYREISNWEPKI